MKSRKPTFIDGEPDSMREAAGFLATAGLIDLQLGGRTANIGALTFGKTGAGLNMWGIRYV